MFAKFRGGVLLGALQNAEDWQAMMNGDRCEVCLFCSPEEGYKYGWCTHPANRIKLGPKRGGVLKGVKLSHTCGNFKLDLSKIKLLRCCQRGSDA